MPKKAAQHAEKRSGSAAHHGEAAVDNDYQLEAIRDRRTSLGRVQYLIKWKDFPEEQNTWEPLTNLPNHSKEIAEFEERFQREYQQNSKDAVAHKQARQATKASTLSSAPDPSAPGPTSPASSSDIHLKMIRQFPDQGPTRTVTSSL